jgi:quinol monooxygenase YgiN
LGRRHGYNDQRDSFRDNPRDGLRDNPRDGLGDYSRDGLRDNGGPVGRHSSARPDWRERDAAAWGQPEAEMPVPEFIPAAIAPSAPPGGAANSRPLGRLLIFTLREDRVAEFDRLAEQAADGVRIAEPDTLVYVFHTAPTEPMQRIIYEIYRDRAAFESHQRQPHIQRFTEEVKSCVLGSNVIDLRLKYAKVAPLQGASQSGGGQPAATPSAPPQPYSGRGDAEPTARHRAPRPLEAASRSLGEERYDSWPGEQAGPAGGGRRAESADDWPSGRDWGRS